MAVARKRSMLTGAIRKLTETLLLLTTSSALGYLTDLYNINMRITQLDRYRDREGAGHFQDLPPSIRAAARRWLDRFCTRRRARGLAIEPWLFAIYCGQARRLALNPPTSAWGRTMLAKRGGLALQRKLRVEGKHPTAHATRCRLRKLDAKKRAKAEANERASLGLPPPARVTWLPLD